MLAGEVHRLEKQIRALTGQLAPLHQQISALDTTMRIFDANVRPDAGGVVRAHAGKYGAHGGLTRCVVDEIKSAGPNGIDTVTLSTRVAIRCNVDLPTKKDLSKFKKDTMGWVVRDLKTKGLIEAVHLSRGGHVPSIWRWKLLPSVGELAKQAAGRISAA